MSDTEDTSDTVVSREIGTATHDTVVSARRRAAAGDGADDTIHPSRPHEAADDTVIGARRGGEPRAVADDAAPQDPPAPSPAHRRDAYAPDAAALRTVPGERNAPPVIITRRQAPADPGGRHGDRLDRDDVDRTVRALARRRILWLAGGCAAAAALAASLLVRLLV